MMCNSIQSIDIHPPTRTKEGITQGFFLIYHTSPAHSHPYIPVAMVGRIHKSLNVYTRDLLRTNLSCCTRDARSARSFSLLMMAARNDLISCTTCVFACVIACDCHVLLHVIACVLAGMCECGETTDWKQCVAHLAHLHTHSQSTTNVTHNTSEMCSHLT